MSDVKECLPDIASIQPDRLIKYRISDDRFSGEVLLPGLWYTDFDKKIGGKSQARREVTPFMKHGTDVPHAAMHHLL